MQLFDVYPVQDINIIKATGSRLWDDKGVEYLDMYGGHAVISIGHSNPHWVKRIEEQLSEISFYSNSIRIPIQQQLAALLGSITGKEGYQLFLCNSGAEANENALKLASFHNGKKKVIAFDKAFHGRTSLAVSATDNPSIIAPVNETDNIIFLPYNDEQALQQCFLEHGAFISSVIVEGIQGVGGIRLANRSFLQLIRTLCDDYNAVYIADSVQCGYGRTGQFFSHDDAGVDADIYSMAKGMGNGFPIGGIWIAPHIKPKHGMLGTTFGGNHLACAAAMAVLEVIDNEGLLNTARERGAYLMAQLQQVEGLEQIRGRGLMIGFNIPAHLSKLRQNLLEQFKVFTGEAKPDIVRLLPALNITIREIDEFINRLKAAIVYTAQQ